MGKPKVNSSKRKIILKKKAKICGKSQDEDALMETASNSLNQSLDQGTKRAQNPTKVVLEDIQICDHIRKSKISKKKEKRKLKKELLLAKLKSSDTVRIQTKRAKERGKAVILGDMQLLMDALPDLPVMEDSSTTKKKNRQKSSRDKKMKQWNNKKWKEKKKEELQDMNLFQKVLQLPEYKQDPICAITNHVGYMMKGNLL